MTDEKLNKLIMKDQLDWFCLKVITNQWKSTSSSFWKIYRNNGFAGSNLLLYYNEVRDLIDDEYCSMNIDDLIKELQEAKELVEGLGLEGEVKFHCGVEYN